MNPTPSEDSTYYIDGCSLSTFEVYRLVTNRTRVSISKKVQACIKKSRELLEALIANGRIIYGVNTSFGGLVHWLVSHENAQELQENLIASVATNVGPFFEDHYVKACMLARLNSLARGASAISLENFSILLEMYNKNVLPCIPLKGSLGASGDLGPLACIALVGIGKWKAKFQGKLMSGSEALEKAQIEPMKLSHKEGLSLINGTSAMTAIAALLVEETIHLVKAYDVISCLSFEGLQAKKKPFNPIVHKHKSHRGQLVTAENLWSLLSDSQMIVDEDAVEKELQKLKNSIPTPTESQIEDAYSIRCTPHILGPVRDNLLSIQNTINDELNSSSDNPLVLPEEQDVFHNGHFHGQYIAMAMDQLSISLTTLSNLSDRRIDRFMDSRNSNKLPAFLCAEKPGLRLGLMGGQFMATSITAENRSLCHPVSTQTLTSTGDFQDIVSLGLVGARRAKEILDNTFYIVAFELMCGTQAAEIRGSSRLSSSTKKVFDCVRQVVPYLSSDVPLTDYLEKLAQLLKSRKLLREVELIKGTLVF